MTIHITAYGVCVVWAGVGAVVNFFSAFTDSEKSVGWRVAHILVAVALGFAVGYAL